MTVIINMFYIADMFVMYHNIKMCVCVFLAYHNIKIRIRVCLL